MKLKIERHWAMPNHKTFTIAPLKKLINEELGESYIDPFPYPFKQDAIKYLKTQIWWHYRNFTHSAVY